MSIHYTEQTAGLRQEINGHLNTMMAGLLVAVFLGILFSADGRATQDKVMLIEAAYLLGSGAWFVARQDHMIHRIKVWLLLVEKWRYDRDHSSGELPMPPAWETYKSQLVSRVVMVPILNIGAAFGVLKVLAINFGFVSAPPTWVVVVYLLGGVAMIPIGIMTAKK